MKTGIELIAEERKEQIEKHGWTAEHDATHYCEEIIDAAEYAIRPNKDNGDKCGWISFQLKIVKKNRIDQLKVAGALIAAEIDRLQSITKGE